MSRSSEPFELIIDKMTFGPEALASWKGKKIFLPWGIPGEKVKVEIREEKKDYTQGKILKVLEHSPVRVPPPCPVFFRCGGCQWQHLSYDAQLNFKNELLRESLQRIGKIPSPELLEPIAAPDPFHYRKRIRLQVSEKGEVGFFKVHSKDLVSIESCFIANEKLNEKIPEAKKLAEKLLRENSKKRYEIEIRMEGEEAKITLASDEENSFEQVNSGQNQKIIEKVLLFLQLTGNEKILELFAGEGNFTFPLSERSKSITAVELNNHSVEKGKKRSTKEHKKNIQWIEATAYRAVHDLVTKKASFDRLLIDPPRKGAAEIIESVSKLKIPTIVYVSCDPATLARDIQAWSRFGYQHRFSQLIDCFPQTYHLESVTKLELV